MEQRHGMCVRKYRFQQGFTLTEAIVVVGLVAILIGIAVPPTVQWVQSAEYRASARSVLSILREARSKAITSNLEHRVEFENSNRRFRVTRGNRASDSSDWSTVVYDWIVLPPIVYMDANVAKIHLNPTGSANAGTITIKNERDQPKFQIRVVSTGRVRIL